MIYLNAEVISGLGEDTFWTWFKREFPTSSFDKPKTLTEKDIVLRYSTLGPLNVFPVKTVAFLRSVEQNPEFAIAHNNLGLLSYSQGKCDVAIRHFAKALQLEPSNLTIVENLDKASEVLRSAK